MRVGRTSNRRIPGIRSHARVERGGSAVGRILKRQIPGILAGACLGLLAGPFAGSTAWAEPPHSVAANQRQAVQQASFEASAPPLDSNEPLPLPEPADLSEVPQQLPPKGEDLALPPRSSVSSSGVGFTPPNMNLGKAGSIAASLGVVVGLFLVFAWVGKKKLPKVGGRLPKEVIQVLGKSQLSGKQQLELVRIGSKLLLLCVTAGGVETLTEITDPVEVERMMALVRQESPGSISGSFQEILSQMGGKPARGFLDA